MNVVTVNTYEVLFKSGEVVEIQTEVSLIAEIANLIHSKSHVQQLWYGQNDFLLNVSDISSVHLIKHQEVKCSHSLN